MELEKRQRKAAEIKGKEQLPFQEIWERLGLITLEKTQLRRDVTEVYQLTKAVAKVKEQLFTHLSILYLVQHPKITS